MSATWYMRSADDQPHRAHPVLPRQSACGLWLAGAKEITEAQIIVFLGGKHCPQCAGIGRVPGVAA